ncbi:MAG: cysteine hydrolase [Oscillospiraceae bacterium]|nr:cysteine hydrolase [Oscillospiraceae bacterium]
MKKILIVVDMQNDFIDGSLGTAEAQAIVGRVAQKIESFDGDVLFTQDTHFEDYLSTAEGKKLPVEHCIKGTRGFALNARVQAACDKKGAVGVEKRTFGAKTLPELLSARYPDGVESIELIGLCTDICVISNALLLKAFFPETPIAVDASCCAGVTPASHDTALSAMRACQIDVEGA